MFGQNSLTSLAILTISFYFFIGASSIQANEAIYIAVNNKNTAENLSLEQLKKIYLGKMTFFKSGEPIELVEFWPLKEYFYAQVLGWNVSQVKEYWMKKVFGGAGECPPVTFENLDRALDFVSRHQGAICFVSKKLKHEGVKYIKIDNKNPSDDRYPLK